MTYLNGFIYTGLHVKSASVEIREAFAKFIQPQTIAALLEQQHPEMPFEFVLISTCNRFDICFWAPLWSEEHIVSFYETLISKHTNIENLKPYLRILFEKEAFTLLCQVASSLDSVVVGEAQILGQVKTAYLEAIEMGYAKQHLPTLFHEGFRIAKKVRTDTQIGRSSLSMSHAALEAVRCVFESLEHKKILLLGSGEMSKVTALYVLSQRSIHMTIASRTFANAQKLTKDLCLHQIQHKLPQDVFIAPSLPLHEAIENLECYDICLVAMGGLEPILTLEQLKNSQYKKKRQGKLAVIVDLSVPRKVEDSVGSIENLFLFNVDDLAKITEQNKNLRQVESLLAQEIIDLEIKRFLSLREQKHNLKSVGHFHAWVYDMVQKEVNRYLQDVAAHKHTEPKFIARAVAKKLVSRPAALARSNIKQESDGSSVHSSLDFLFSTTKEKQ